MSTRLQGRRLHPSLNRRLIERELAAWHKRRTQRALAAIDALVEGSRHLVDLEDRLLLKFAAERAPGAADVAVLKTRRRGLETSSSLRADARSSPYRVLLRVNTEAGTVLTASGEDAGVTLEQVSDVIRHRFS